MGMRRQQLLDLADAYAIEISNRDAVRDRVLREMLAAQEDGKLVGQAKRPFCLAKALRRSDDPPLAVEAPPEERVAAPVPMIVQATGAVAPEQSLPPVEPGGASKAAKERMALIRRAKELALPNPMKMKTADLRAAIKEAGRGN